MLIKKSEKGTASLEACIILPIFILILMFLYGFMVFFTGHQHISHALIQGAESLSLDPYATERLKTDFSEIENGGELIEALYANAFTTQDEFFSSNKKWYENNDDLMIKTVKRRFLGYFVGSATLNEAYSDVVNRADEKLKTVGIVDGFENLDFSGTKIDENGYLTISIKYKQEFVYNFQGLASFDREQKVTVKLWDAK